MYEGNGRKVRNPGKSQGKFDLDQSVATLIFLYFRVDAVLHTIKQ